MSAHIDLTMTINSDNAAFSENAGAEVARIMRALADRIDAGVEGHFNLYDINGNAVGAAVLEVWGEDEE